MLDYDALKNVLCSKYTDYVLLVNKRAQLPDRTVNCVPGAGFGFLKF